MATYQVLEVGVLASRFLEVQIQLNFMQAFEIIQMIASRRKGGGKMQREKEQGREIESERAGGREGRGGGRERDNDKRLKKDLDQGRGRIGKEERPLLTN